MREKQHRISPRQLQRVRDLRRDSTFPERLLWSRLRAGRASGLKFRRQAAIGGYIIDFYCPIASLGIELDGLSHEAQRPYDERRTSALQQQYGLHLVRYTNDQVLEDLDAVVEDILRRALVRVYSAIPTDPPLTPP